MTSFADQQPQVSTRARLYGLEDDGASARALKRRRAKNSIASCRQVIAHYLALQKNPQPGTDQDRLRAALVKQEARLIELQTDLAEMAPPVLAPVGRRVKREDRRQNRKDAS